MLSLISSWSIKSNTLFSDENELDSSVETLDNSLNGFMYWLAYARKAVKPPIPKLVRGSLTINKAPKVATIA